MGKGGSGFCVWLTGLPASGKTTIAALLSIKLDKLGIPSAILDGDDIRKKLCPDLGFSREDRVENIRRATFFAKVIVEVGGIAIVSCISPYTEMRREARETISREGPFVEVFVRASLEECEARDPKGLYKKALAGEIENFTGISDPYEKPVSPEVVLETEFQTPGKCCDTLMNYLYKNGLIPEAKA